MDAADYYTGIVPDIYAALRGSDDSADRYREFVEQWGGPTLELGCGDSGPFFELAQEGVDIDGVDSSTDMVRRAQEKLAAMGLTNKVVRQRMQRLDLERTYCSIYLAGPTFTLLADDSDAVDALIRIRRHLNSDGAALIPLWTPKATDPGVFGIEQSAVINGATAHYVVESENYDEQKRTRTTQVRYEMETADDKEIERREWIIHWHTDEGFRELADRAGLDVTFTVTTGDQVEAVVTPRP